MPRGCAICLKSTSHAHRDNDHEGNSPENGIYRKFDVEALRRNLGGLRPVAGQRCQTKRGASQGAATSTKSDAQSIYELPSSFTCRLDQILRAGDNGVRIAPNTIHSNRWRSIAHAALYFGCVPSENAGFGWGKFSFGHHLHSFRPEMARASYPMPKSENRSCNANAKLQRDAPPRLLSWQHGKCNLAGLATVCGERLDASYRPCGTMSLTLSIGHTSGRN